MHKTTRLLTATFLAGALISGSISVSAAIYKTTDKDGNVIFTDIPPQDQSGELEVSEHSSYTPPPAPAPAVEAAPAPITEEEEAEAATIYTSLQITTPEDDQAIRENAGNVTIVVKAEPALDTSQGHRVEVLVDGVVSGSGEQMSVLLNNLDRGTHVVIAQIVDADGNPLISAEPVTFHLLRYSALLRPRQPGSN